MPRIRYLKPDFFSDEHISELAFEERLLFAGLWCYADKAGRLEYRPKYLKAMIFPYDDINIEKCINSLCSTKKQFIKRYVVEEKEYLQIVNWHKHQKTHYTERESKLPACNNITVINNPLNNNQLCYNSIDIQKDIKEKIKGYGEQHETERDLLNSDVTVKEQLRCKSFIKPTIEEVQNYCTQKQYKVDAEQFCAHYESKGWMIGKNKMKCWRSAIITWLKNDFTKQKQVFKQDRVLSETKKTFKKLDEIDKEADFNRPIEVTNQINSFLKRDVDL